MSLWDLEKNQSLYNIELLSRGRHWAFASPSTVGLDLSQSAGRASLRSARLDSPDLRITFRRVAGDRTGACRLLPGESDGARRHWALEAGLPVWRRARFSPGPHCSRMTKMSRRDGLHSPSALPSLLRKEVKVAGRAKSLVVWWPPRHFYGTSE